MFRVVSILTVLLTVALWTVRTLAMAGEPKLIIIEVTCELLPNKYIDRCKGWTEDGYGFLSLDTLTSLSPDLHISYSIRLGEETVLEQTTNACEALKDVVGEEIIEFAYPSDKLADGCDSMEEGTYEIRKYFVAPEKIPPYSTDGQMVADIEIAEDDGEPFLKIHGVGEISSAITSFSTF